MKMTLELKKEILQMLMNDTDPAAKMILDLKNVTDRILMKYYEACNINSNQSNNSNALRPHHPQSGTMVVHVPIKTTIGIPISVGAGTVCTTGQNETCCDPPAPDKPGDLDENNNCECPEIKPLSNYEINEILKEIKNR